jgi:ribosomal protein S18 acetylase RimI-like enzyme
VYRVQRRLPVVHKLTTGQSASSKEVAARIAPRHSATQLRPANAADGPFVKRLFCAARAGDFAAAGLPQVTLDLLLEQQFRAQAAGYAAQFPDAASLIVLHRDAPVGRLMLVAGQRCWHIIDIVLMPSVRGQGIGRDIIEAVISAATAAGAREITLSVLFSNVAARRLYERHGFVETGDGVHIPMAKPL